MKPVLVSGSLAFDRIMDFKGDFSEHFMPDKLHSINVSFFVTPPREQFGGCAGNITYSLSLLETASAVVATAGSDFGPYEKHLKARGIATDAIAHRDDVPTSAFYVMTDQKGNQIGAFAGGSTMHAYEKELALENYGLAIVSPNCKDDMVALPEKFREAALPYFFDPGQQLPVLSAEELRAAIEGAAGVFANDYELALIAEKTGWAEADIAKRAGFLIVTLGAEGSRIITRSGEERVAALAAREVVDPTGAGDAFRAGFIAGFTRGAALPTCAKLGSAVAVHAVECYGTQNHTFTMAELKARYESAYKESFPI